MSKQDEEKRENEDDMEATPGRIILESLLILFAAPLYFLWYYFIKRTGGWDD